MYIDHSFFSKAVPCLTIASLVVGLGLVPPEPVHGQQAVSLLEEIVVTARRREESLKDVPVAITALSGDYLAEAGVLDQYGLFGNNLTDEDTPRYLGYNGDRNINPNQSQWNYWLQLRIPREVGARLTYQF